MEKNIASIQNYLQISANLATGGQPFREQFAAVQEAGVEVVINLATAASWDAIPNEGELWQELGIEYHNIPVLWEDPRPEDLARFSGLLDRLHGKKIFIHCARNMRVSVFLFIHRLRRGEAPEVCQADLQKIWQPNETWQAFIRSSLA